MSETTEVQPTSEPTFTQADIDRRVTEAVKTAQKNFIKSAVDDPKVVETISAKLAEDAQKTAEQKYQEKLAELDSRQRILSIETNKMKAREKLISSGIVGEDADYFVSTLVDADADVTDKRIDEFAQRFTKFLDKKVEEVNKTILTNSDRPQGGEAPTPEDALKQVLGDFDKYAEQNNLAGQDREAAYVKFQIASQLQ